MMFSLSLFGRKQEKLELISKPGLMADLLWLCVTSLLVTMSEKNLSGTMYYVPEIGNRQRSQRGMQELLWSSLTSSSLLLLSLYCIVSSNCFGGVLTNVISIIECNVTFI